jgi:hypothetical protein
MCFKRKKINLSTVDVREVEDQIWQGSFLDYDLGSFDKDEGRVEPGPNLSPLPH